MSLQVWLPLTKDLRNQGLNGISVTSTGTITLNDSGKLGKCYKTSNTGFIDLKYAGTQINTGSISLCGWFKFNKSELAATWSSYSFDSSHPYPTGNLIGNNSYGGVGLIWYTNSLASGAAFTSLYVACSIRSTANGARITNVATIPFDTWVHLALVFNKTTKALELWMNGELKVTNTMLDFDDARSDSLKLNYSAVWGGNGPSYNIPFYVNDVRIYDHALSQMEIKQLSQGLVLHYTLSDDYIEATTNLITSEDCLSSTCYNASTSKYSYGTSTDIYKTVTTYDGRKGTKVYMGTNGNACYPYVYVSNMYTSDGTNQPAYKTLSFDYYGTIGNYLGPYPLGSGNGTATYKITCAGNEITGTYTGFGFFPVTPNKWNHIEVTFHGITAANSEWGYIRIGNAAHTSNTSNFWFFANMQLEVKDHATGYAGVGGTRTPTIVYDNSGFCNNGTIFGALTITSNTPKYTISTQFNGTDNAIQTPDLTTLITDKNYTIACWFYKTAIGTKSYQTIYGGPSGFELEARNGGGTDPQLVAWNWGKPIAAYEFNKWNHFVFVHSDSDCKIYLNGEYISTGTAKATNPSGNYFVGAWNASTSQNYEGLMSDFRIYATALSPTDVKSLYQNCATIDADGTIHGQIRS